MFGPQKVRAPSRKGKSPALDWIRIHDTLLVQYLLGWRRWWWWYDDDDGGGGGGGGDDNDNNNAVKLFHSVCYSKSEIKKPVRYCKMQHSKFGFPDTWQVERYHLRPGVQSVWHHCNTTTKSYLAACLKTLQQMFLNGLYTLSFFFLYAECAAKTNTPYTKTLITNKCTKRVLSSILTHSYMFRPCWVIFRENDLLSLH
jgi:hypothetical protein